MQQKTENNKQKTVNYLIVGQGIAGSLLAWELHRKGKTVAVVDEGKTITSSKIAAGMFNPINTKRFTVSATAEQQIRNALEVYRSMETELGITIVHEQNIYNIFGNIKESNDLSLKLDHPFFKQFTNPEPTLEPNINQLFGAFEVGLSGWVDLNIMLSAIRNFIGDKHVLFEELFEYNLLKQENGKWLYKDMEADNIIFCEGYKGTNNPFFTDLTIIPCKGDVLEFEAPELYLTRVVKKGIYIVQIGEGKFKCGSTYKWENNDEQLQQADYDDLNKKIAELIMVPYKITNHYTAIRPTTKTREMIFKQHETLPNMFVVNGLGTKGLVNGVKVVKQYTDTL